MKKLKHTLILLSCLLFLILVGCSSTRDYQKSIYSDDLKIAKEADSYSYLKRAGSSKDNSITLTFKRFDGSDTIWIIDSKKSGSIKIDFDAKITKGSFKAVIITPDKKVSNIFENTASGSKDIQVLEGKNRLKFIGNNSTGEVSATVNLDKDMKLYNSSNND
jgi:hypothetical protein